MYIFISGDHENNESKHTQEARIEFMSPKSITNWNSVLHKVAHCSAGAGHDILINQQFNRQRYILSHWYHIECLWWFEIMIIIIVNCVYRHRRSIWYFISWKNPLCNQPTVGFVVFASSIDFSMVVHTPWFSTRGHYQPALSIHCYDFMWINYNDLIRRE